MHEPAVESIRTSPPRSSPESARRALAGVPAFRPVAVRLLQLMRNEETAFPEIISLLRTDAVITAQVVRLANSALFATRCEIKNVLQALSFLGLERLNSLLITTALRSLSAIVPAQLSRMCWRHNLAVAILAKLLAKSAGFSPDRCYIAGLIHDIGCLAMLRVFPHYEDALEEAERRSTSLCAAENALFGIDHAEAGRWLLAQWGCPIDLQQVAAGHERPGDAAMNQELLFLIHAASLLADRMSLPVFPKTPQPELEHIVEFLPPQTAGKVLADYREIAEWTVVQINQVELSLF